MYVFFGEKSLSDHPCLTALLGGQKVNFLGAIINGRCNITICSLVNVSIQLPFYKKKHVPSQKQHL
jgi:hypothetical protein